MKMTKAFISILASSVLVISQSVFAQSKAVMLETGNKAFRAGKYEEAIKTYKELLRQDSTYSLVAYDLLGQSYESIQDDGSAFGTYLRAIRIYNNPGELGSRIVDVAIRLGLSDTVLQSIRDLAKRLDNPQLKIALARIELKRGNDSQARTLLQMDPHSFWRKQGDFIGYAKLAYELGDTVLLTAFVQKSFPTGKLKSETAQEFLQLAQLHLERKKYTFAEKTALRVIENQQDNVEAYLLLWRIYLITGNETRILTNLPDFDDATPSQLYQFVLLARSLENARKPIIAETVLQKIQNQRAYLPATNELMREYFSQGRMNDATSLARSSNPYYYNMRGASDSTKAQWNLLVAKVYFRMKDMAVTRTYASNALEYYRTVTENDPWNLSSLSNVAFCNLILGDLSSAEGEYQKFINRAGSEAKVEVAEDLQSYKDDPFVGRDVVHLLSKYFAVEQTVGGGQKAINQVPQHLRRDAEPPMLAVMSPMPLKGDSVVKTETYSLLVSGLVNDDEGIDRVYVGELVAKLSDLQPGDSLAKKVKGKGFRFSQEAMLNIGSNEVYVRAVDISGNVTKELVRINRIQSSLATKPSGRSDVKLPNIWAVVVGISRYESKDLQLEFADKDAQSFYSFLKSPNGGAVSDERIDFLTNRNATRADILRSINEKLRMAFEDDEVVVYLACHGVPDEVSNELYFLGYDSDPKNVAGTGISQLDIQKAISKARARKVLLIADACHSGGVSLAPNITQRGTYASMTNKLLQELAQARDGVAILTASSASEFSQEGKTWGGHGVFTHHLVNGLQGSADTDSDGIVTIREIYEFVYRKVADDTGAHQHPDLQGRFDNNLPLSVIK